MNLPKYIRDNQKLPDGTCYATLEQLQLLRRERVVLRHLLIRLVREFKRWADPCMIPTRWCKAYRAAKAHLKDRTK